MDLELIETGEPINFDYMVRCTNIDVPGSFHPIISGQTHFKALSTGAAVAVSAPHHYCKRSQWALETSQNYKQIGAIPGPFGCMTGNALHSEPQSCAYPETLERNGGKFLQVIDDGVLESHLYSIPFVTEGFDMEALKSELAPDGEYFCAQNSISVLKSEAELKSLEGRRCVTPTGKCPTRERVRGKDHPYAREYSEQIEVFSKVQYSNFGRLKNRRLVTYLDPNCTNSEGKLGCDIRKVHPMVPISTDKGLVFRMLRKPEYKGFSIQSTKGFTPDDFGGFSPTGFRTPGGWSDIGVLFVNDKLVCDGAGRAFSFFDFKNNDFTRWTTQY